MPTRLTKPVSRRINDNVVATLEADGVRVRFHRGQKSLLVPWLRLFEMADKIADGTYSSGRLFEAFEQADKSIFRKYRLADFTRWESDVQPTEKETDTAQAAEVGNRPSGGQSDH